MVHVFTTCDYVVLFLYKDTRRLLTGSVREISAPMILLIPKFVHFEQPLPDVTD
jgi:hypothetical protein